MMHLRTVFLFVLVCCCSSSNKELLANDVFSKLNENCQPTSCCDVEEVQAGQKPPCDCDEACSRYGTCCIDSPFASRTATQSFTKREQCSKVHGTSFAAFMISSCNPRWRGNRFIWSLCEGITQNDRDPLVKIPVTNPLSKITYKNYFCSLCNFDEREGILWNVVLTVHPPNLPKPTDVTPAAKENILYRLQYLADRNSWGIWQANNNSAMDFIPITVSPDIPSTVKSLVKSCDATVTESRCATSWNDAAVRMMCQSYLLPITVPLAKGEARFRNPHCAVCNYVSDFKGAFCKDFRRPEYAPSLSFTLLLDVNPSDGDKVGESSSCAKNEVYDPFFKKCRALVCALPGRIVKDGRCAEA